MQIGFIVILVIAIFIAIFAIQNGTPVPIDLFFARYEMPLAVIMMVCLVLGAVIILVLGTTRQFKKRSEQKELKNKLKTFETEKAQLALNVKSFETEKDNLQNANKELSTKITELSNQIKLNEEALAEKTKELELLKAQKISDNINAAETTNEGEILVNNGNSEVNS